MPKRCLKSKSAAVAKAAPAASAAAIAADDDFWDEGLKTVTVAKEPAPLPPAAPKPAAEIRGSVFWQEKAQGRSACGGALIGAELSRAACRFFCLAG